MVVPSIAAAPQPTQMEDEMNDIEETPHGGAYVYCKESGSRLHNGTPLFYGKGEAWAATDPFVAAHRDLFQSEPVSVRATVKREPTEKVERATRAPGERRGPSARGGR